MIAQGLDAHPGAHEGAQHGTGRGADDDVEVARIDAVHLVDGLQRTDRPGPAEHAATAEDEAPARENRISHGIDPPSLRHCQSTRPTRGLEEFGKRLAQGLREDVEIGHRIPIRIQPEEHTAIVRRHPDAEGVS